MKKYFLLSLAITLVTFIACEKDSDNYSNTTDRALSVDSVNSEAYVDSVLLAIKSELDDADSTFFTLSDTNISVSNLDNTQETSGTEHNRLLDIALSLLDDSTTSDTVCFVRDVIHNQSGYDIESCFKHDSINNVYEDDVWNWNNNYYSNTYMQERFNDGDVSRLQARLHNAIINYLKNKDGKNRRTYLIKEYESIILNNTFGLEGDAKNSLLGSLSVLRNSYDFWTNDDIIQPQTPFYTAIYDYIGYQIATTTNIPDFIIDDGSDINAFATLYSSIAAAIYKF